MTNIPKITTLILSFLLITSFKEKEEVYIWYPHKIGIIQSCNEKEVEFPIDITTGSKKSIKVHSFNLDKTDFVIYIDNQQILKTDTFLLSENKSLKLKVRYKISTSEPASLFSFKTNLKKYLDNQIKLSYGQYLITSREIREGKELLINISESCQDSVRVEFPYGGTVSSAVLYSDSSSAKRELKSITYDLMEKGNYFVFSKTDIGRYYVDFGSCHWGNEFWLTIK